MLGDLGCGPCGNLLVPVCLSAAHAAYGFIRREPVFIELGQAEAIAIGDNITVQKADYSKLRARLDADGQPVCWSPKQKK